MRKILPFEKASLPYQNRVQDGGRYYYTGKSSNLDPNKNFRFQNNLSGSARMFHHAGSASNGKYCYYNSKGSSCHQFRTGSTNKDCNFWACISNIKKTIYKKHSKCTISRNTTLLHNSLGKNYSGSRNIIYCKKEQNLICKSPILGENTKLDKYVKRTIFISGIGSFGNDGERSFPESSTQKRETSEQHFPCRKKGWRELNSDKFKKSQKIHFLRPFQDERSVFSKILSRTERLAMQDRSQEDIFFGFPQQKLSKVCHISLVRQSTLIYLPILRT